MGNKLHDPKLMMSILEYSSRDLLAYAKEDTPARFARRLTLGRPRVIDAQIDFSNGNGIVVLDIHKHDVTIEVKDIVGLIADEIIENYGYGLKRNELVKVTKSAVRLLLEYEDIKIDCDCKDYKYRFNWIAKQFGVALRDRIVGHNYPPKIANPKQVGVLCKHQFLALSRMSSWSDPASRRFINQLLSYDKFLQLFDLDDVEEEDINKYDQLALDSQVDYDNLPPDEDHPMDRYYDEDTLDDEDLEDEYYIYESESDDDES